MAARVLLAAIALLAVLAFAGASGMSLALALFVALILPGEISPSRSPKAFFGNPRFSLAKMSFPPLFA
jgi:hypothetical protein